MRKAEILKVIIPHIKHITYIEKRNRIKDDLLDQLERNNTFGEYYVDLVNDYMDLWDVKNELVEDIGTRGVSVKYQNGQNQWGYKKNDSVAMLQSNNNQMIRLLKHLGLNPSKQDKAEQPFDMEM